MTEEYKIINTKCPILSENFVRHIARGPNSEILVRLKGNEPIDVICPKYQGKGICGCRINEDSHVNDVKSKCIYSLGWRSLK